jgi:hypothetical protein
MHQNMNQSQKIVNQQMMPFQNQQQIYVQQNQQQLQVQSQPQFQQQY